MIARILCEFDLNLLIMRNNRGAGKAVKVRGQGNPGVNTRRERAGQKKMEKIKGVGMSGTLFKAAWAPCQHLTTM